jgi:hypothetical protein
LTFSILRYKTKTKWYCSRRKFVKNSFHWSELPLVHSLANVFWLTWAFATKNERFWMSVVCNRHRIAYLSSPDKITESISSKYCLIKIAGSAGYFYESIGSINEIHKPKTLQSMEVFFKKVGIYLLLIFSMLIVLL